jgi:hypothetical protein
MGKQNKKTADQVLADTQAKAPVPDNIVSMFKDAVNKMEADIKANELPVNEATGNRVIIDPIVNEPQSVADSDTPLTLDTPAPVTEPAPVGIVEASSPMPEGVTDDERAPLLVVPPVKPKEPRKPIINWSKVNEQWIKGWSIVGKVANKIGASVIGFVIICGYLLTQVIPAMCYVTGWIARGMYNAFMHGWSHAPLITEGKLTEAVEATL